jgi:NADPH-dependent curcumin reductase CurA
MQGFIVFDYEKEYPRALRDLAQWLSEGKIKRKETIVKGGLVKAEEALRDLYNGVNTGKRELCTISTSTPNGLQAN